MPLNTNRRVAFGSALGFNEPLRFPRTLKEAGIRREDLYISDELTKERLTVADRIILWLAFAGFVVLIISLVLH